MPQLNAPDFRLLAARGGLLPACSSNDPGPVGHNRARRAGTHSVSQTIKVSMHNGLVIYTSVDLKDLASCQQGL